MARRDSFLLRLDPRTLDALRRWAADDLRSVNAQIDFLLQRALRDAGRLAPPRSEEAGGRKSEARKAGPAGDGGDGGERPH